MTTKKSLAILLSKLKQLKKYKLKYEQYTTPSEIAADWLYNAYMLTDIKNKIILDLGAGNGVLGIAALFLGAKKVIFVDIDRDVLDIIKENLRALNLKNNFVLLNYNINDNIDNLKKYNIDTIIQNPPFGKISFGIDRVFLEKSFLLSKIIYSMHLYSERTIKFFTHLAKKYDFKLTHKFRYKFLIKNIYKHHLKSKEYIQTVVLRFRKNGN